MRNRWSLGTREGAWLGEKMWGRKMSGLRPTTHSYLTRPFGSMFPLLNEIK